MKPALLYSTTITDESKSSPRTISRDGRLIRFEHFGTSFNRLGHFKKNGGLVRRVRGNEVRVIRKSSGETRIPPIKTDASEEGFVRKWRAALGEALIVGDLEAAKRAYSNTLPLISPHSTKQIAQLLHQSYRQLEHKNDDLPLIQFALQMTDDWKSGKLAPHPWAVIHLLGLFKESGRIQEGVDLWNFIAGKDDRYLVPSTYGAIIELLTVRGDSLASLEELYSIGLKSNPGSFAEYHLAPNSMVKDRSKRTESGNKLPIALLQGIYEARLKHDDFRNAYLALDTVLRLAPDYLSPRFFHLPILDRSAPEAYAVFILACRMGINLGPNMLKIVLSKMNGMANEKHPATSYYDYIREQQMVLRGMLNAVVAFVAVGGQLDTAHQRSLYARIRHTTWRKDATGRLAAHARTTAAIGLMAQDVSELFIQLNVPPDHTTFSHMIIAASVSGSSNFDAALQYVSSHDMEPSVFDYRAMLIPAAEAKDVSLLQQIWSVLIRKHHDTPHSCGLSWQAFARACNLADCIRFGREELALGSNVLPLDEDIREKCLKILELPPYTIHQSGWMSLTEEQASRIAGENANLRNMTAGLVERLTSGKPLAEKLPNTSLLGVHPSQQIREEYQSSVYDDLTADGTRLKHPDSDLNPMGIPFDKLRFENWKSINDLIYEATVADPRDKDRLAFTTATEARRMILKLRGLE